MGYSQVSLSVIVPVYNVAPYLEQCLDSILSQSFEDFELIAVDDASTDNSGVILDRYVSRDARVRKVTLAKNSGLSGARNAGLKQASGEFVWFIDSDDWITGGAMQASMDRLRQTGADVVIFGWVRDYPDGRKTRHGGQEYLSQGPTVFTLVEWPRAIGILHTAWNKIVRRALIEQLEFQFQTGLYEDPPFTYPILAGANKITTLDLVCVHYRQREVGSITQTVSDRHFEIFKQWDRAHELVARDPIVYGLLRPLLISRMLWHYSEVLSKKSRLPQNQRRRFFQRMTEQYRTHCKDGKYRPPHSLEGLGHRLIGLGWYHAYDFFERARRKLRQFVRK